MTVGRWERGSEVAERDTTVPAFLSMKSLAVFKL